MKLRWRPEYSQVLFVRCLVSGEDGEAEVAPLILRRRQARSLRIVAVLSVECGRRVALGVYIPEVRCLSHSRGVRDVSHGDSLTV